MSAFLFGCWIILALAIGWLKGENLCLKDQILDLDSRVLELEDIATSNDNDRRYGK